MKIEFYKHNLSSQDKNELMKVLDSIFLTTGEWTKKFEEKFSAYLGSKYVVGLTSCTNALELSLKYFGIKCGDEVITTPLSFIATANSIEYCGAKPIFVDLEEKTGNINTDLIEKAITPKTKAIVPVHLYGQMADMKKIKLIADKHNLKLIEDSAHCLEGQRDGLNPGRLSDAACFSFYATKSITSGEGGAIACSDSKIYNWLLKARLHGMSKDAAQRYCGKYKHYDMDFLGFKCNMSNIQAALLVHQVDKLDGLLSARENIAQQYNQGFQDNQKIKLPEVAEKSRHARSLYTIWVEPKKRDEYLAKIQEKGIGVAVNFRAIHLMHYYKAKYGYQRGDFPVAERIADSTITLPLYPRLEPKEIEYIIDSVNKITKPE